MFINDMFNEDSWHAGDNAWSSEHDQWAKESADVIPALTGVDESHEDSLEIGDEVLVTYRNEFQGKRGEIVGFGRNKAFVIVEIDGRDYSMHSSDVERLGGDYDNEELDEYRGPHDKVTFEIDSEKAYNHVMDKFGHVIDWSGDYMTVPERYWPAVQELAFAAGGDVQEIELSEDWGTMAAAAGLGGAAAYGIGRLAGKMIDKFDKKYDGSDRTSKRPLDKKYKDDGVDDELDAQIKGRLDRHFSKKQGVTEGGVSKTHISPSGVKTNMPPTDDDYEINYGKNGLVAKDRKSRGVDVATGTKKVAESKICPVCGCTPCNCTHIIKEGASMQEVFNAITYRIERQMPELFTDYGVEVVANAIKDVAEFYEGAEELGSSDVGAMVRAVVRNLKQRELRKALDEVKKMSTQQKFEKHLAKHGYDVNAKQKYWDQKIKDIDAQIAAWDAEMAARKQNKGVAEDSVKDVTHGDHPRATDVPVDRLVNLAQAKGPLKGREAYVRFSGPLTHSPNAEDSFVRGVIFDREQESGGKRLVYWLKDDAGRNMTATARDIFVVEQGVAEGEYDDPRWEEEPHYKRFDPDAWKELRDREEEEAAMSKGKPSTVTVRDAEGNVVLQFPSTGGYYGDVRYAKSKGFDTEAGDYDINWKRIAEDYGTGIEGGPKDTTSPIHGGTVAESNYWTKLQQERFLKEHKTAFAMLDELQELLKDK